LRFWFSCFGTRKTIPLEGKALPEERSSKALAAVSTRQSLLCRSSYVFATRGRCVEDLKGKPALFGTDCYLAARVERAFKQHPGEVAIDLALDGPSQWTGPELEVVALLGQKVHGLVDELTSMSCAWRRLWIPRTRARLGYLLLRERSEDDDPVYQVRKLGPYSVCQRIWFIVLL
jgi:hypothetical protein